MTFNKLLVVAGVLERLHVLECRALKCILGVHTRMLESVRVGECAVGLVRPNHERIKNALALALPSFFRQTYHEQMLHVWHAWLAVISREHAHEFN